MTWTELETLKHRLRAFAKARDWEQFHSPKNLAMALAGETGELLEHFQWLTEQQSETLDLERRRQVAAEIADIQIYLVRLADRLDIDIGEAVEAKLAENERRYPADRARGSAAKYTDYEE